MSAETVLVHGPLFVLLFVCSAVLTKVMIGVGIADVPNDRSSHTRPVPTSGGLAVAATFVVGTVTLYFFGDFAAFPGERLVLFVLLAGIVAAFSLYDDVRNLSVRAKIAVQLACALAFSLFVANVEVVSLPVAGAVDLGPWGHAVTVLWIVAFMNAFNFMDGINGIAGGGAMIASVFLGAIAYTGGNGFVYLACLCLAPAILGFLVFNFPRGRIFLGDTGSQFIAFVLAGLAVLGSTSDADKISIFIVPMLFFPFLYDVAVTLVYRLYNGRDVFSAHREHHYQLLNRLGLSHRAVSALYFLLVAVHGIAAVALQRADPDLRLYWFLAAIPVYACLSIALYRAAMRAGLASFAGASARRDERS